MTAHGTISVDGDIPPHVPKDLVWTYDFSADAAFQSDPLNAPNDLTKGAPDIFFSPLYGGFWVVRRFDDIREMSRQPDIFSNYPAAIPATVGRSRKMDLGEFEEALRKQATPVDEDDDAGNIVIHPKSYD